MALSTAAKNLLEFLRRHNLKLIIRTVFRPLVFAPSSKLRSVTEATTLHVVVRDLDYQLGSQRLPGQILALTPATLRARNATTSLAFCGLILGPLLPRMIRKSILTIRSQELYKLATFLIREARAYADVLQRTCVVE